MKCIVIDGCMLFVWLDATQGCAWHTGKKENKKRRSLPDSIMMWPVLTKGGESRWEDHDISGENTT